MSLERPKEKKRNVPFNRAWLEAYHASGRKAYLAEKRAEFLEANPASTADDLKEEQKKNNKDYNKHALKTKTRLLTFLGLPDQLREQGKPLSGREIFSTVLAVIMIIPSFVKNSAKLLTEFLPKAGYFAARHASSVGSPSPSKRVVMRALAYLCNGLHFIGRAITSPSQGVRQAYRSEYIHVTKNDVGKKPFPRPVRIGLAVLSGLITAVTYAVLLPFVISVAAPGLVVAGATLAAKSTAISVLTQGLATVGSYLVAGLKFLGITSVSAAVVGASSLAVTAGTVGSVVASEADIRVHRKGVSQAEIVKSIQKHQALQVKAEEKVAAPVVNAKGDEQGRRFSAKALCNFLGLLPRPSRVERSGAPEAADVRVERKA